LVLTTCAEAGDYGSRAVFVEELDDNPFVFKGQILSRLTNAKETLLMGVDPGTRIGMAVYYGNANLEYVTFDSVNGLRAGVTSFIRKVPAKKKVVRIGNGNRALAMAIALSLMNEVSYAIVEVVDEAGTSARSVGMKGVQGDQRAAARIAFRRGVVLTRPNPRTSA
jgi:hypothetical protein